MTDEGGSHRERKGGKDFRAIFEAECAYVWKSLRRLGVREADLEDVTHEVFLTFHKLRDRYDPSRPLRPYLFAIAARCASDYRRRAHRRHEVLDGTTDDHKGTRHPENEAADAQARSLVLRALDALEPDRRAVFVMHDIDETSMPEIALALGIPLNTGYSRLRLARKDFTAEVARLKNPRTEARDSDEEVRK